MLLEIGFLIAGLCLIIKGSEWITDAAIPVARFLNTTYVAVGLVLVSVLLSLPELFIAASVLLKGHEELGIGTVIGSIIVNIGLIIGISAVLKPLKIPRHMITRDGVFMVVTTIVVTLIVMEDMHVSSRDGFVFLLLFIPYLINLYEQERMLAIKERHRESEMIAKTLQMTGKLGGSEIVIEDHRFVFIVGIAMLLVGTELFSGSLIFFANSLKIPEILIGLTIGALGPSIPNLAAALQAVRRGYDELAVSETIGSNIFTLLITLGIIAIVKPFTIDAATGAITTPSLLIVTITFFIFACRGHIGRKAGLILIGIYLLTIIAEIMYRLF